jgi:hypothetical protein
MTRCGEVAHDKATEWYRPFNETRYAVEIVEYWERIKHEESMEDVCEIIGKRTWT